MEQMKAQKQSVYVLFMDPPRSGSTEQFLDSLVRMNPNKIVYISCNPVTLERDLSYVVKYGYKVIKAIPVDMFPMTEHVEAVVKLGKQQN